MKQKLRKRQGDWCGPERHSLREKADDKGLKEL